MQDRVLIVPIDGKLPNLALMRLAAWERSRGAEVTWRHELPRHDLFTPQFDRVWGSAIFSTSRKAVERLKATYPHAVVGGSGGDAHIRIDQQLSPTDEHGKPGPVPNDFVGVDYSAYPDFTASLGYAMRGCRFRCDHCVVPGQEGRPRVASAIDEIWRGPGFPKHLQLFDNDFFGSPGWRKTVRDIIDGGYKVCLNQGVTARVMNDEQAEAVAAMHPWADGFDRARLYIAWDSHDQERVYFRGIDALERAGWKASWCFSYMLIGFDPEDTWERINHRFNRMVERGIRPYPMVFGGDDKRSKPHGYQRLKRFQRWVIQRHYMRQPFDQWEAEEYRVPADRTLYRAEVAAKSA